MENKIYHHNVQIYYEDTDFSGVVYHPNFLKFFERAREHVIGPEILAQLWSSYQLGFAVYKTDVTYQDGVEFSETVDIRTKYHIDGEYRTIWNQEVWRKDAKKPAVIGLIHMVCMDNQKKLTPMPKEIVALLSRE
jgi:acyl-CoA thioester hydrolase